MNKPNRSFDELERIMKDLEKWTDNCASEHTYAVWSLANAMGKVGASLMLLIGKEIKERNEKEEV